MEVQDSLFGDTLEGVLATIDDKEAFLGAEVRGQDDTTSRLRFTAAVTRVTHDRFRAVLGMPIRSRSDATERPESWWSPSWLSPCRSLPTLQVRSSGTIHCQL